MSQGEDDPSARLVSDAENPARASRLPLLFKYCEGRAFLQDARLRERRQSYHVVIGWYARGEREQLVLQEQKGALCAAVRGARPETGPLKRENVSLLFKDFIVANSVVVKCTQGCPLFGRMQDRVYPDSGTLL